MAGDISVCYTLGSATGIKWVEPRDTAHYLTMQRIIQTPSVSKAEVEKPGLDL